ncbi:MAG: elongation factor G [Fimbriimonadaceae bacterium]|nr:elongation factor G [Fimbriimonadaceae bacterium]
MAKTADIRNVALIGHRGGGKTSLVEGLLHVAGVTNRLGAVNTGTAVTDFDDEERARQLSIGAAVASFEYRGKRLNLLDTPGYADFMGETYGALRVADAAILVLHAEHGVEVESEKVWGWCVEFDLPVIVVVGHLDGERAALETCLEQLESHLGARCVALQVPQGEGPSLAGVVDLLSSRFDDGNALGEVPAELGAAVEEQRAALIEFAAENDEALMEKFFEGEALAAEEIAAGLRLGLQGRSIVPVLGAAATRLVGVRALLETIVDLLPSPADRGPQSGTKLAGGGDRIERPADPSAPFSAFCFKALLGEGRKITLLRVWSGSAHAGAAVSNTTKGKRERLGTIGYLLGDKFSDCNELVAGDIVGAVKVDAGSGDTLADDTAPVVYPPTAYPQPIIAVAVHAKSRGDEEKIGAGLNVLRDEDPCFRFERNPETEEQVLSGMGDMHLQVILSRLKGRFKVEVDTTRPKIAFRETVRLKAEAQGRYKKQSGGSGQFGDVLLRVEPGERSSGFEFLDEIFGGVVPQQYRPSVEKGVRARLLEGFVAGFPMVDIKVALYHGSYHTVDSSDLAFQMAGRIGLELCVEKAQAHLLEPILDVWITIPEEYVGDIMADLPRRRGTVMGSEGAARSTTIRAQVPEVEMSTYATDLRSLTQGRGSFRVEFSRYEEVPGDLAHKIVAERKAAETKK